MGRHEKTERLLGQAADILAPEHPMTVRQVYYQLVTKQIVENVTASYNSVQRMLVDARRNGEIPWDWIEDRLREGHGGYHGYASRRAFLDTLPQKVRNIAWQYNRDIWATQPRYAEVWIEKDALSGIFARTLAEGDYDMGLNICRGYTSWSALHDAAQRLTKEQAAGREGWILYFGDFDPSGEDMVRHIINGLMEFGVKPMVAKIALTPKQIELYQLPHVPAKETDKRHDRFVEKHGDMAVELDALPVGILRNLIRGSVEQMLDMDAFRKVRAEEARERDEIAAILEQLAQDSVARLKNADQ